MQMQASTTPSCICRCKTSDAFSDATDVPTLSQANRVYLHEYISTVADIFEAPPNKISTSTK